MNPSMNRATVFLTDLRCDGGFRALSITSGFFGVILEWSRHVPIVRSG